MVKKRSKQRQKEKMEEKTPGKCCPKRPEALVGRAMLCNLATASLSRLLAIKKLPGRSKIKTKSAKIDALEGLVTIVDLEQVNGTKQAGTIESGDMVAPRVKNFDMARQQVKPQEGARFDIAVSGIDVGEDTLVAAIAVPGGIEREATFSNDEAGINALNELLDYHDVQHVAMESTAEYWLKTCWALEAHGKHVLVSNALQTKAVQGVKTDKRDARRIALAFRDGRLKPSIICTPEQFTMRKLNREAIKMTANAAKAICRLKVLYHLQDAPEWVRDLHESQRGLRILSQCLELKRVEQLIEMLAREYATGKGSISDPDVVEQRAKELAGFINRLGAVPENKIRFAHDLEEHMTYSRMATENRLAVLKLVAMDNRRKEDLAFLVTIPSIGIETALTVLVEIVDIRFFWNVKTLSKWSGMATRVNQSGHYKRSTGHVYKGGDKWLRQAMFMSAKVDHAQHTRDGHPVGRFVSRLYADKKKPYKVAVLAGGRKMLGYVFHVLNLRKPFQEIYVQEENDQLARNRQRKLRDLTRLLREASLSDLLPIITSTLRAKCLRMIETDRIYARQIVDILGSMDFGANVLGT
jgi:transposase